jgi:Predicted membrane protein
MNHKKTIVALTVVMMAFISLSAIAGEDSDAVVAISDGLRAEGFANNSDGTLIINFNNMDGVDREIIITVTDLNDPGKVYVTRTVTVPDGKTDVPISFRISDSGDHEVRITCEPQGLFYFDGTKYLNNQTMIISVSQSIWSNMTTYIAIAVVAILIVIAAVLKMRSAPATKPDTTFTELEKQKDSKPVNEDVPQTTSRRRYNEEKSAPVQKETKATSFTELEKSKAEPKPKAKPAKEEKSKAEPKPKDSKPAKEEKKKEDPKEQPKKIKYVSSRRK